MEPQHFEALVADIVATLPSQFAEALANLVVVVEDWPDAYTLRQAGLRSRYELLGFYHGVPQTQRTSHYGLIEPDRISIYQFPIEAQCRDEAELIALARRVVLHEIAHHFGIDDDRLRAIGAY